MSLVSPDSIFYMHRSNGLLTLELPNCEGKTCSMYLLPLFHLLRTIWWFLFLVLKALEMLLRWGAAPSLHLSLCGLTSCFLQLQDMGEKRPFLLQQSIPCTWLLQLGPHGPFVTSHTSPRCAGTDFFTAFAFSPHEDSSALFHSTPLFTHLLPITSHQSVLGEFISVYSMLWSCPNNGDVTLLHFYKALLSEDQSRKLWLPWLDYRCLAFGSKGKQQLFWGDTNQNYWILLTRLNAAMYAAG